MPMVLFIQLYVYDDSHLILRAAAQKRIRKLDVCVFSFYYMSMVIYFLEWQHKRGLQH
jgi:hypothetical protein